MFIFYLMSVFFLEKKVISDAKKCNLKVLSSEN